MSPSAASASVATSRLSAFLSGCHLRQLNLAGSFIKCKHIDHQKLCLPLKIRQEKRKSMSGFFWGLLSFPPVPHKWKGCEGRLGSQVVGPSAHRHKKPLGSGLEGLLSGGNVLFSCPFQPAFGQE